jgi:putative nucleotidyltransferase with HDIG domain
MMTVLVAEPTIESRIAQLLDQGTGDLPVLPRAAEQALKLAGSTNLDFDEVARVGEADPPLAARILSVANSALYFRGQAVTSVRAASVRIGAQALRDVLYLAVYSGTIFDVPRFRSKVEEAFRHSTVVARLARALGERAGQGPEAGFLPGLLHDVGKARCLRLAARKMRADTTEAELTLAVDRLHARAGASLVRAWRLPDPVVEACEHHHAPEGRPMATLIAAADTLAHHAEDPPRAFEAQCLAALERLGRPPVEAPELLALARAEHDRGAT